TLQLVSMHPVVEKHQCGSNLPPARRYRINRTRPWPMNTLQLSLDEPAPPAKCALRRTLHRLLPVGFAVVGIGLSVALGHLDNQREESEQIANISARLSGVRGALEAQLRAAFGEAEGIAQL